MSIVTTTTPEVVVIGLGPAGRAATSRFAAAGVSVVAVDPSPERRWTPTYAAWADELPGWLPPFAIATRTERPLAWADGEHVLDRPYVVLDTAGLQEALPLDGAEIVRGSVVEADQHTATLTDGSVLSGGLVLDARGTRPDLATAAQTAYGLVVPNDRAAAAGGPWFMDWRRDNGTADDDAPSFLYAVPVDDEHTLLEETCLVGRPALGLDELRRRLLRRLDTRGVSLEGDERVERVRFSVQADPSTPEPGWRAPAHRPVALGSRAGLMHPSTGYSVALSLDLADRLAQAVASGHDIWRVVWPASARQVRRLREVGLTTLLRLPPDGAERFFAAFFDLPPARQRSYLSDRTDPLGTLAAMTAMAGSLPPGLTAVAVTSALGRPARPARNPD